MNGVGKSGRLDRTIEIGASALFAAAVGFAAWVFQPALESSYRVGSSVAAGVAAYLAAAFFLKRFEDPEDLPLPDFQACDLKDVFGSLADEMVGCEKVESGQSEEAGVGELLLDDIVGQIRPEARVIRLFDPAKMPTAGELQDRIEQHLGAPKAASPDSTRELYDALAALRQSLR